MAPAVQSSSVWFHVRNQHSVTIGCRYWLLDDHCSVAVLLLIDRCRNVHPLQQEDTEDYHLLRPSARPAFERRAAAAEGTNVTVANDSTTIIDDKQRRAFTQRFILADETNKGLL